MTSSWQITTPQAVWISHGAGSKIFDVDGNEYVDLHGGYGAGLAGHAHPAIVEAVQAQVARGTHFAQPTETAIEVAEELGRRFGLPLWRFCNSGTEATMDAVHLMRSITGRDLIIKVEGCYHGHHDSVQVSVAPEPDEMGPSSAPIGVAGSTGIPQALLDLTLVVGFNDLDAVERVLVRPPRSGGRHDHRADHDERRDHSPRRGLSGRLEVAAARPWGAAHLRRGQDRPDGRTGGGGRRHRGDPRSHLPGQGHRGRHRRRPPSAARPRSWTTWPKAATRWWAPSTATPWPWRPPGPCCSRWRPRTPTERIDRLRDRAVAGLTATIAAHGLEAHVVAVGAKGCVVFRRQPVTDYRGFVSLDDRFNHAHWLIQHNGGVFLPPWGKTEQWLISTQHDDADIDRFLANFERLVGLAGRVTGRAQRAPPVPCSLC